MLERTTEPLNPKVAPWNRIGEAFWNAGYESGPTEKDIELYLADVTAGTSVAVLGASTFRLIQSAAALVDKLTVIDFSPRMLSDLLSHMDTSAITPVIHDLTQAPPTELLGSFDVILGDRIINRFTELEAQEAFRGIGKMLRQSGTFRTGLRLGLYERDLRLIAEGHRRGTLSAFFDPENLIIDYGHTGDLLAQCLDDHGAIPHELFVSFYRERGPEKRFGHADIDRLVTTSQLRIAKVDRFIEKPRDLLYTIAPETQTSL